MIKKMAIYGGIEHLNVDESFIIFEKNNRFKDLYNTQIKIDFKFCL